MKKKSSLEGTEIETEKKRTAYINRCLSLS